MNCERCGKPGIRLHHVGMWIHQDAVDTGRCEGFLVTEPPIIPKRSYESVQFTPIDLAGMYFEKAFKALGEELDRELTFTKSNPKAEFAEGVPVEGTFRVESSQDPWRFNAMKLAITIPMSREVLATYARTWQERAVILGSADPNPFPKMNLFRRGCRIT